MTKRFLSVWLPQWPIERRRIYRARQEKNHPLSDEAVPFALVAASRKGLSLTACSRAARAGGIAAGMALADARAICPALATEEADPDGDAAALRKLALWCQSYSPLTQVNAPDGVSLDITGCAHLFGGEAELIAHLSRRLAGFGLSVRCAAAPTLGAAWALARFGDGARIRVTGDALPAALSPLPLGALRLEERVIFNLERVGLKTIGDLLGKPRAPLTARFGAALVLRLDQAFGKEDESFGSLSPPSFYHATCRFAEPLSTLPAIEAAARYLIRDLARRLEQAGKGARRLELALFQLDGKVEKILIRIARPSRDPAHLSRLLCERLGRMAERAGFGFEAARLSAWEVEGLTARQQGLSDDDGAVESDLSPLIDRLANRFGADNIVRFMPRASYLPERGFRAVSLLEGGGTQDWEAAAQLARGGPAPLQPLLLLARPEPITALSELPDGPPLRFQWRRVSHLVTRADGPERIAPEWWRADGAAPTRDYYRVEDEAGHRFWLYREGLYDRAGDICRWFVHGVLP